MSGVTSDVRPRRVFWSTRVRSTFSVVLVLCLMTLPFGVPATVVADGRTTTRVSVASNGDQANAQCLWPSISADGRYVTFQSEATNLAPHDTNTSVDVFLHDRVTGATTRVDTAADGSEANQGAQWAQISADGRFVVFESFSTNLVSGYATRPRGDLFVKDLSTGAVDLVSVANDGSKLSWDGNVMAGCSISADGRYVAFTYDGDDLVPGHPIPPIQEDVYVRDRVAHTTKLVSASSGGEPGNGSSDSPCLSADGRFVVFQSAATNLVANDTNDNLDAFVHDNVSGATTRVSLMGGNQLGGQSTEPVISADGRYVAFTTQRWPKVPDLNWTLDVVRVDRTTGQSRYLNTSAAGAMTARQVYSGAPCISADGRHVAFDSYASSLVSGDNNNKLDLFMKDAASEAIARISVSTAGDQGNGDSGYDGLTYGRSTVSADARCVAFESKATNLVANDTNNASDIFVAEGPPPGGSGSAASVTGSVASSTKLKAPSSVKVKKALKLSGTVSPGAATGSVKITKTRKVGKKWKSMGSATVGVAGGAFKYSFKPTAKGSWQFVATYSGSSTYAPSKSTTKTVKVK